jgi:hypothetical protein
VIVIMMFCIIIDKILNPVRIFMGNIFYNNKIIIKFEKLITDVKSDKQLRR